MTRQDNKLLSVVEHWLPRIEIGGIPSATATDIIARAGSWNAWLATWSEAGERQAEIAADAEARGWRMTAGEAYARASLCYHFGQFMAFEDLAAKSHAAERKCELYRRAAPLLDPPARLLEVPFEGKQLRGFLRLPAASAPDQAVPLAFIIPGSDSTKEEFPAFEKVFLSRGIATFSFDGPGQGEGRSLGPLRPDISPAIEAAAEVLRDQAGLSGKTILVGMAFGGHLALRAAATLDMPEAVVSINGFADLGAFEPRLPQVYRDNLGFALGTADISLRACDFSLAHAERIVRCPALILHGGRDGIFPPDQSEASAEYCGGHREVRIFSEGNHVCNNIPWLYRPLVADWIGDRVSASEL